MSLAALLLTVNTSTTTDLDLAVRCARELTQQVARRRAAEAVLQSMGAARDADADAWVVPVPLASKQGAPNYGPLAGVVVGAVLGAGGGAATGSFALSDERSAPGAILGAMLGAGIGALIGAGVGVLIDAVD